MNSDDARAVEDLHRGGGQAHGEPTAGVASRYRVEGLPDTDPRLGVDSGPQQPGGIEGLAGKPPQQGRLGREGGRDRTGPAGDHPLVVADVCALDQFIECGQRLDAGQGHEMPATEPADLTFHTTVLMGSAFARAAKETVESVVAAQRDEPLRLNTVPALKHPRDSRLQVVILNYCWGPPEVSEREYMPLQKRLLRLRRERCMKRPPRIRQPHHEHPTRREDSTDECLELPEVDLRLDPRQVSLGHHHLDPIQPQLHAPARHITRHRHLRQHRTMLGDQPLPNPPRGMPLLTPHLTICQQPPVDHLRPGIHRRPVPPDIGLARRRQRTSQRLTHRSPVYPMARRQLPNRQLLDPTITPNPLEQLHPRSHPSRPPTPNRFGREDHKRSGANIRADTPAPTTSSAPHQAEPKFTPTTTPPGARSGDHTHACTDVRSRLHSWDVN